VAISSALFPNPYELSRPEWRTDSSAFTFEYNQRGHEVVWMSERDGWNHLYLYDGRSGEVKNQITKGEWVVRGVSKVDEERRQVWFSASGMYPGKDPYFVNYYRVGLDGMGLTRLTEADANHAVSFSSDMKYYVDTYSRVDLAPVSELRLTADGSLVTVVERADITELVKAGWKPPEVFVAAGRDGTTEIWGVIFRVGIYGTSAGGQNSLGALLFHPEFYKATVSAAGCHDNRMDKIWWNEQWMGWPIGPQYAESSNVENAYRLQGALLLVVGEMDTNVDPSSTMQVVNQLIKHDKPFDLLVIPGAGHGSGGAYGDHKRYDFFVRELLGLTPPKWAAIEKNRQK
jgi:dipeptidyl aminopeptidase/acylaminoacyl peptidase